MCKHTFFFFMQKTAYEVRISDWSSDVCSSDLPARPRRGWKSSKRPPRPVPEESRWNFGRKGNPQNSWKNGRPCLALLYGHAKDESGAPGYPLGAGDRKSVV